MARLEKASLNVRNARVADIEGIRALMKTVYPNMPPYTADMLRGQIANYTEGQFIALYDDKVIGYCGTFRIDESIALAPHTWVEITGGGFASRHDPIGDVLYGMEVCVDPEYRGLRIGQRFYNERKALCERSRLKGIVFAGRLPGLARRIKDVGTPEEYVRRVQARKIRDTVLSFQIRNGFEVIGVLPEYLPSDQASLGYATHMQWRNPRFSTDTAVAERKERLQRKTTVRVAAVQYMQRQVKSFEEFCHHVEYFVDVVADYGADFVIFPEMFSLQLLSIVDQRLTAEQSIAELTKFTEPFKDMMSDLAIRYNVNIIGGSHPSLQPDGDIHNVAYVFLRDGAVHTQEKLHPTPNEKRWWNIKGGEGCSVIMTDCGNIGVMICYDSEFPELSRHLTDQGAQILFVPFCTDTREAYLRVRYCAAARAVENQIYVAMAGNVGNLPGVENMDIQYAESCILTPCDFPFARDGVAADTTPNTEMVAFADLRLDDLAAARNAGTVQNLKNRRFDLYSVDWHAKDK